MQTFGCGSTLYKIIMPYSELINKIRKKKDPNETTNIIRKMKTEAPVLSTILDYGGKDTIDSLLKLDPEDRTNIYENNFGRILHQSSERQDDNHNRKSPSFLEYKASPIKHKQQEDKTKNSRSNRKQRTSVIVEMPSELKVLRNEIVSLPSISRYNQDSLCKLDNDSFVKSKAKSKYKYKRMLTDSSNDSQNLSKINATSREAYLQSMKNIFSEFDSPAIHCNSYILSRHQECKLIQQEEERLYKRYKRFEKLGSPPKRIISLMDCLGQFQSGINEGLDDQLKHKTSQMDEKRYELLIKHEEQNRKLNVAKFIEKKRQDRLQQINIALSEQEGMKLQNFKLNSKGKVVFENPKKNT